MAQSVKINNVSYNAVPSVQIPLASGSGNAIFYDTSGADIAPEYVLAGKKGFGPNGLVNGTMTAATVSQDSSTKVLTIS